jgi:transcriptional regulator with XRE-family HTH domain
MTYEIDLGDVFRSNLSRLRQTRGMTQGALALACGFSRAFACQLESGVRSPSMETLEVLAGVLGVPPAALLSDPKQAA